MQSTRSFEPPPQCDSLQGRRIHGVAAVRTIFRRQDEERGRGREHGARERPQPRHKLLFNVPAYTCAQCQCHSARYRRRCGRSF